MPLEQDFIYFAFMMSDTRIITLKRVKNEKQGNFKTAKNWVIRKNHGELPICGSWGWTEDECLKRLHDTPIYFGSSNKKKYYK